MYDEFYLSNLAQSKLTSIKGGRNAAHERYKIYYSHERDSQGTNISSISYLLTPHAPIYMQPIMSYIALSIARGGGTVNVSVEKSWVLIKNLALYLSEQADEKEMVAIYKMGVLFSIFLLGFDHLTSFVAR